MALRDFPAISRPDNASVVTGKDGDPIEQSEGKQVTRAGTTSLQGDYDIVSYDLIGDGDYETGQAEVGGASEVCGAISSDDSNAFSLKIEWLDQDKNVLYTQEPAAGQNTSDYIIESITIKADNINIIITDESGGPNSITGTINIH